jgi:hypothetical protein
LSELLDPFALLDLQRRREDLRRLVLHGTIKAGHHGGRRDE